MTLDVAKFISNSIRTQAKIQHLDISTKTVGAKDVPDSVSKLIFDDYGEKYLLDADYVSFFWGEINKENISKLFNVVDKALGKSANKLTETDFKKLKFEDDEEVEVDIEDDDSDDSSDEEETEEVEVDDNDEDDDKNELNEDEEVEVDVKTSYFFLKITLK